MAKKSVTTEQGILDDVILYLAEDRQIVYEDGSFWVYRMGAFWRLPDDDFRRAVIHKFPSLPSAAVDSALRAARWRLRLPMDQRFFAGVKPVVVFTDCTVEVTAEGLRARSHSPEDRARFRFTFPCPFEIPKEFGPVSQPTWRVTSAPGYGALLATLGDGAQAFEEFGGAVILGIATKFKKALYLVGPKDAGKSQVGIFLRTLLSPAELDGNRWIACVPPADMSDRFKPAALASAILNLVDDKDREVILTGLAKTAIAGGEFTVERKYQPGFTFRSRAGWLIIANEPPKTDDPALLERFLVVECAKTYGEPVHDFGEVVAHEGGPFAVGCMLLGAVRLLRGGYTMTDRLREIEAEVKLESDPVALFFKNCTDVTLSCVTTPTALYNAYRLWAISFGFGPHNLINFSKKLQHYARGGYVNGYRKYAVVLKALTPEE